MYLGILREILDFELFNFEITKNHGQIKIFLAFFFNPSTQRVLSGFKNLRPPPPPPPHPLSQITGFI